MRLLVLLLLISLSGCAPRTAEAPPPTPRESLLQQADSMLAAQNYEGAAVAYRERLDQLEKSGAPPEQQQSVREKCTRALVEAGGFVNSQRLWEEMAEKNPEAKDEAERMKARAERMMLQQGEELLALAAEDFKSGHKSKALAAAQATEVLFEKASADSQKWAPLKELMEQLKQQSPQPD